MLNPELIMEARKLESSGAFQRKVMMCEPYDIQWDRVILECGHQCRLLSFWRKDSWSCRECLDDWIKARS